MSLRNFAGNDGFSVRDTHFCAKKTVSLTGIGTVDGTEMETELEGKREGRREEKRKGNGSGDGGWSGDGDGVGRENWRRS